MLHYLVPQSCRFRMITFVQSFLNLNNPFSLLYRDMFIGSIYSLLRKLCSVIALKSPLEGDWCRRSHNYDFTSQSRIIGAVRGAHSQLWGTIISVCSLYAARKYDRRFGTPAIV